LFLSLLGETKWVPPPSWQGCTDTPVRRCCGPPPSPCPPLPSVGRISPTPQQAELGWHGCGMIRVSRKPWDKPALHWKRLLQSFELGTPFETSRSVAPPCPPSATYFVASVVRHPLDCSQELLQSNWAQPQRWPGGTTTGPLLVSTPNG